MEKNSGKTEVDELEIIDAHSHLGDILYEEGGKLIDKKGVRPTSRFLDTGKILGALKYKFGELKEPGKFLRAWGTYAGRQRNFGATLENMQKALGHAGVSSACVLPIPPNVRFDDLKDAQQKDNRIIPFTGVDFRNMENFEAKMKSDVERGAKGMKIHPIIQNVSPQDRRMYEAVEEFAQYDLPVIFHSGAVTYYFGEDKKKENPEYGRMDLIEKMVADFRGKVNVILGHAGMFEFNYAIENMAKYPNVFVDTTFQHPERIIQLINTFGTERVVFGSDWPYGEMKVAVECVKEALQEKTDRQETAAKIFRGNIKNLIHLD